MTIFTEFFRLSFSWQIVAPETLPYFLKTPKTMPAQNVHSFDKIFTPGSLDPEGQGRGLSHMTARTLLLKLELFSLKGVWQVCLENG